MTQSSNFDKNESNFHQTFPNDSSLELLPLPAKTQKWLLMTPSKTRKLSGNEKYEMKIKNEKQNLFFSRNFPIDLKELPWFKCQDGS